MTFFGCKCCKVLEAENDHLRKWIDRLMSQKAPEPEPKGLGALANRVGDQEDDIIYQAGVSDD